MFFLFVSSLCVCVARLPQCVCGNQSTLWDVGSCHLPCLRQFLLVQCCVHRASSLLSFQRSSCLWFPSYRWVLGLMPYTAVLDGCGYGSLSVGPHACTATLYLLVYFLSLTFYFIHFPSVSLCIFFIICIQLYASFLLPYLICHYCHLMFLPLLAVFFFTSRALSSNF